MIPKREQVPDLRRYMSTSKKPAPKTRAVNEHAKRAKRANILRSGLELYDESDAYEDVTMSAIARRAGVAKGTVYLYFDTKEALFFDALSEQTTALTEALQRGLLALPTSPTAAPIARVFTHELTTRPTLLRLYGLLHATLEKNVSVEQIKALKLQMLDITADLGALLEEKFSELPSGQGVHVLPSIFAIAIGVHQLAHPSPRAAEALQDPAFATLLVDFEALLEQNIHALLDGWRGTLVTT